jgi:hypothetical protein
MRRTELITRVREEVSDELRHYWTDATITRRLNFMQRSLFRKKCDAHASYGLVSYDLSVQDNAQQLEQTDRDEWTWHLPSWVYRVQTVFDREATFTKGVIPLITGDQKTGWKLSANRAVSIKGSAVARDLRLKVAKVPALMIGGIVSKDSADPSHVFIPGVLPLVAPETEPLPIDFETGAMINAQIEITSSDATHDPRGVIATVRKQTRQYDTTLAAYVNLLEVKPSFHAHVKATDTFDSHSEIEEVHIELLILTTVESLFAKTNNIAGVQTIQSRLAREWNTFINSLQPREDDQVHQVETFEDTGFDRIDPDRDLTFAT